MEFALSTGKTFTASPLKLAQVKRMTAAVEAGRALDATVQACADSTGIAATDLEESLTMSEANELFFKVMEVSGLKMGELKAATSTSMTSTAASLPIVQ